MIAQTHDRTAWRGVTTCTWAATRLAGACILLTLWGRPDIAVALLLSQGSYSTGVAASAGTHARCGVVDISRWKIGSGRVWDAEEWALIVRALRAVGFAAWHRLPGQAGDYEHIHAVSVGCPDLSWQAAGQVADYLAGRDGLAAHGRDTGPRDWVGVDWVPTTTNITQEDTDMTPAQEQLLHAIADQVTTLVAARTAPKTLWVVDDQGQRTGIAVYLDGTLMHPPTQGVIDALGWVATAPDGAQIGASQLAEILAMQGSAYPAAGE